MPLVCLRRAQSMPGRNCKFGLRCGDGTQRLAWWSKRLRTLVIAAVISTVGAVLANAQVPTPSSVAVGPWRTGVAVKCADGRTIPANTVISGPNVTAAELCGGSSSGSAASTGGAIVSNTGNFQQDMLTNSVNLMIVSNTKNPIMSSFMQGAATGFISAMFANNAEAQRQQALMAQEVLRRNQMLAEQRRIAEQQRLDAMYARLSSELKLEGLPFGLSLKAMNSSSPDSLQLKGMGSSGPGDLKLKIGEASPTAYGLKGLPGIYVGGPAGGDGAVAATTSPDASGGNPNLANGPGTGPTGPGIPGLPGIYLDSAQSSQAPQLAQAAENLKGPERAVAQDVALQAAQQNPTLTGSSQDPQVQNFQQANQEYQQAVAANSAAGQAYQAAQTHVEADKSAIDVARSQLDAIKPSIQQQEAFNQMLVAAKTDEEASMLARQNFDSTQVHLSASRDRAAAALAQATPAQPSGTAAARSNSAQQAPRGPVAPPTPALTTQTVDLSQASQPLTAPLLRATAARGGPIQASLPAPSVAPMVDIDACLANATHSSVPPASRPTAEQLRAQLEIAKESLKRLLETHKRESEDREEWAGEMKKGGVDIGFQAFDLTAKFVLGSYVTEARKDADWARNGMNEAQRALETETDVARQSALEGSIAAFGQERAKAEQARELLEKARQTADQGGKLRDLGLYINDSGDAIKKAATTPDFNDNDFVTAVEGYKQIVKTTLSDEKVQHIIASSIRHAEYVPLIDRTVTIGGALIDTGYDLTVEYLGFWQLRKADENSELFYRGAAPLQKKIETTVNQLKCF